MADDGIMRDSRGTPIPAETLEHIQRPYAEAATQAITGILATGHGWGFATLESEPGKPSGIVIVAADERNTRKLLKALKRLGIKAQQRM